MSVVPQTVLGYLTIFPTGQQQPFSSTTNSDGRVKSSFTIVPAGTGGAISAFASNQTNLVIDVFGYFVSAYTTPGALQFYTLAPCRVLDTRLANGPFGGPHFAPGEVRSYAIPASSCNVPSNAAGYSLNLTLIPQTGAATGYVTAWPTLAAPNPPPSTSSLNPSMSEPTANASFIGAGLNGAISIFSSSTTNTDVLIDINGYFAPAGSGGLDLYTVFGCRAMDTRLNGIGNFQGAIPHPSGLANVGNSGCNISPDASAYLLNATAVPNGQLSYITLWGHGGVQPALTSTLNAFDGVITNNLAVVTTTNGGIDIYAATTGSATTALVMDVYGYFAPDPPVPPYGAITGPSNLYFNLSQIPFDHYDTGSSAASYFPTSCPTGSSVRGCIISQLASLYAQKVSGVRFMFSFCGGFYSTALTNCPSQNSPPFGPNVNPPYQPNTTWNNNVNTFLSDVANAGIRNIIVTPQHVGIGGDSFRTGPASTATTPSGYPCSDQPDVIGYWAAAPFGTIDPDSTSSTPIGENQNGWNCAPINPYFIGWQNLYNVMNTVITSAAANGLTVSEIDGEQELNLVAFPAQLRYVIDNAQNRTGYGPTPVTNQYADTYSAYQYLLSTHNFNRARMNYSAGAANPTVATTPTTDCLDVYTDYARLIGLDAVAGAIAGGLIGEPTPPYDASSGFYCGGTATLSTMVQVPVSHPLPDIIDLHAYPCVRDPNDIYGRCMTGDSQAAVQSESTYTFSDIQQHRLVAGRVGALLLLGETHSPTSSAGVTCEGAPADAPGLTVSGYNNSSAAGLPILWAPWFYLAGPCYSNPISVNPPYIPTQNH